MIRGDINNKELLIPYLEKLNFQRSKQNRFTYYFDEVNNIEIYFDIHRIELQIRLDINDKLTMLLRNIIGYRDVINYLNYKFKIPLRKIAIQKLIK